MLEEKKCKVEGCGDKYYTKGYCRRHYSQMYIHGKILERTMFDPNKIIDCGNYYEICLYNIKQEEVGRALIDKEDLKKIKNYKWYLDSHGYVMQKNKNGHIFIHQLIMGKPPTGYKTDHWDRNKLNNRKYNLRFVTNSQSNMNRISKGYRFKDGKWEAQIGIEGKYIYLGRFDNEELVKKAVQEARQKYHGEFTYKETN